MSVWIPVIVAVITGVLAVLGQKIISNSTTKELYAKLDKQSELADQKLQAKIDVIDTKIETLSARVNAHNQLIDRMYKAETNIQLLQQEVEVKK